MDKVLLSPELHPIVKQKALELQEILHKQGITILYTQGYRDFYTQARIYAQGRTLPGKIVTNAKPGYSPHNYGLAVDFVPLVNGKAAWDRVDLFEKIGAEAKKVGFEWGGDFKSFLDRPHLQIMFGLTIKDLLAGKRPKEEKPMKDYAGRWSEKDIDRAQQLGIMKGYPDGAFMPDKNVTREELAVALVNLHDVLLKEVIAAAKK